MRTLSPPFVIRITSSRGDRYYRDRSGLVTRESFAEALSLVNTLRPFPKGQYPAVTPLISVPVEQR